LTLVLNSEYKASSKKANKLIRKANKGYLGSAILLIADEMLFSTGN
jgi:hypothetical protein